MFVKMLSDLCKHCSLYPPMPRTRMVWSATIAAAGVMTTGSVITVTIAARVRMVIATKSTIAATAVPVMTITRCATAAATVWTNAVSAMKNAVAAIRRAEMSAMCVTKNARSASTSSAMTAASVPNVPVTNCIAQAVCCVSDVQIGYATVVRAVQTVPSVVPNATNSAIIVVKMSFARIAESVSPA